MKWFFTRWRMCWDSWEDFGLLQNPASEGTSPDTHFSGSLAIAAFNKAGRSGYAGAKVPVENTLAGGMNDHWRQTVLGDELMTGLLNVARTNRPLNAITIHSLADLGYEVDLTAADSYRLPATGAALAHDPGNQIPYGDDIWRGPIVVEDRDGRIVRVIPALSRPDLRQHQ